MLLPVHKNSTVTKMRHVHGVLANQGTMLLTNAFKITTLPHLSLKIILKEMRFHSILSMLLLFVLSSSSALNLRSTLKRIPRALVERQLNDVHEFEIGFCTDGANNTQCSFEEQHDLRTVLWEETQYHLEEEGAIVTSLNVEEVPERTLLHAGGDPLSPTFQRPRLLAGETWWFSGTYMCHTCYEFKGDPNGIYRRRETALENSITEGVQAFLDSKEDFCIKGTAQVQVIMEDE